MKTLLLFLGILGASLVILTSCMDNSNQYGSNPSPPSPPPPNTFDMSGASFTPSSMTVAKGTTVTWRNLDGIVHTSTSDSSGLWNTGDISPKGSKTTTFNTAGTFTFHCIYHRSMGMVGSITVQ